MIAEHPHQQRVIVEAHELADRLAKLVIFGNTLAFNELPETERDLLTQQSEQMVQLLDTLHERIRGFHGLKRYRCHKHVAAKPMTRGEYSTLRGWQLPANEDGADAGYLVEYVDSGNPNHDHFANHISWSPKDVFDQGYKETK